MNVPMKKNSAYSLLFFVLSVALNTNAQLILTQSFYQPIVGDVSSVIQFDSVNNVPQNIGQNQIWNFSSITQSSNAPTSQSCIPLSSVPSASLFSGATIVTLDQGGIHSFFKSTTAPSSQLEYLGYKSPNIAFNYTNTFLSDIWPFTYGTSYTDSYSGTFSGSTSGTTSGISTKTGTGTGTLILPGGETYYNVLQIKRTETTITTSNLSQGPSTSTTVSKIYTYMHESNKSPILSLSYFNYNGGSGTLNGFTMSKNLNISVGIPMNTQDITFIIYPNPSNGILTIELGEENEETFLLFIINLKGELVKTCRFKYDFASRRTIDISDLTKGLYIVKLLSGSKTSFKKLVLE